MKIVHLSDLHLGKKVNEYSMIEDQKYILKKIINIIDGEKPDCVILAGDIYDKSVPSTEAVDLFDDFLFRLSQRDLQIFVISGNHDSPERLAFGGRLMNESGVHLSPVYDGDIVPFTMKDEYGAVNIYMLPFVKPANVHRFFVEEEINTYTDALRTAIEKMSVNTSERNILITHQFVTGAERAESEDISVGGTDNVDTSVFDDFDYVALGHIHRPQNVSSERIRYCGTPLKYSFSEAKDQKSVTVAELEEKGTLNIRTVPLVPKHDMVELKGSYNELSLKSFYDGTSYQDDYVHITLTDEDDILDAVSKLRAIYHNLMKLDYDNARTRHTAVITGEADVDNKSPVELFSDFYRLQNGTDMTDEQSEYVSGIIKNIWEDEI
ncbi:MAG: exonuclease SbcCD subunit D [Ruminiclostridium sp.]|nr:exonuclease SbcCD subunit D [Ruminiclostridium sp.]